MAFPLCKLISLTAPKGAPASVAVGTVVGNDRFTAVKVTLQQGEFDFDDRSFIPFQNEVQLKLGLNEDGGGRILAWISGS